MGPHRCTHYYKQNLKSWFVSVGLYFPIETKELSERPIHNVKMNLQKNIEYFFFTAIDTN